MRPLMALGNPYQYQCFFSVSAGTWLNFGEDRRRNIGENDIHHSFRKPFFKLYPGQWYDGLIILILTDADNYDPAKRIRHGCDSFIQVFWEIGLVIKISAFGYPLLAKGFNIVPCNLFDLFSVKCHPSNLLSYLTFNSVSKYNSRYG